MNTAVLTTGVVKSRRTSSEIDQLERQAGLRALAARVAVREGYGYGDE
jgi:hypothetical protein